MKFNDDNLMLFDLDSCLDYNTYNNDTYDNDNSFQFSNEYVDFNDLDNISNSIKPCSLINEIDLFSTNQTNEQNLDFTADFCDFTDSLFSSFNSSPSFNSSSSFNSSLSSSFYNNNNNSLINMTNQNDANSSNLTTLNNQQDKRDEVKKKLLDLTQRKLNTLCFDTKLRNQVLLKSALKSVNSINDDNLLGTNCKLDKNDKDKFDFKLTDDKTIKDLKLTKDDNEIKSRKRNFKSNSLNLMNDKDLIDDKNQIKKQKLSFIDENQEFNYNDELTTINNLANCFIKLKTQHN